VLGRTIVRVEWVSEQSRGRWRDQLGQAGETVTAAAGQALASRCILVKGGGRVRVRQGEDGQGPFGLLRCKAAATRGGDHTGMQD
jgi:hypothetical protein